MSVSDNKLIPAEVAVESLCHVADSEVSSVLGFPLITKAEPYAARAEALVKTASAHTHWLIAAVIVSSALAVVILLALVFLLHRYKTEDDKHNRLLLASPGPSSQGGEQNAAFSPNASVSDSFFLGGESPLFKTTAARQRKLVHFVAIRPFPRYCLLSEWRGGGAEKSCF